MSQNFSTGTPVYTINDFNCRDNLCQAKLFVLYFPRWLNRLESLIIEVNEKFQHFFGSMGFAGEVHLHRGNSENDFANYGIDILVKFRENMPLQKLDPFRQSGKFLLKFKPPY